MKVVALFQIYLPYYLPRTEEWSAAPYLQHHFDVEGQIVNVHPRKADEQLFPNSIDKQLAQLEIQIESGLIIPSDAPRVIAVRDRCFDRIEAQVFGEVSSKEDCPWIAEIFKKHSWTCGALWSPSRIHSQVTTM